MKCKKCNYPKLDEEVTCVETGTYDIFICPSCKQNYRRDYIPTEIYEVETYVEEKQ